MTSIPAQILDSHHHLWNPVGAEPEIGYVWLRDIGAPKPFGDPTPIQRDYLINEFVNEPKPVQLAASVHLQCDPAIPDPVAETAFIQHLADERNFPIAIVGYVNLAANDAAAIIERHKQYSGFRGVRQIVSKLDEHPDISFAPEHFLHNARWRDQFGLLADNGLSFDLQIYPEQMADAAQLFGKHSNTPIIIDHAGSPYDQSPQGIVTWQTGLEHLAELPNTMMKLSGFGMFDRSWNSETIKPLVDTILSLFGHDRVMFGSNFPVDKLMATYEHTLNSVADAVGNVGDEAMQKIFFDNAKKAYRIDV